MGLFCFCLPIEDKEKDDMKKTILTILIGAFFLLSFMGGQKVYAADTSKLENGDIVEFGSYPQSLVTNSDLIGYLNLESKTWYAYPYYNENASYLSEMSKNG